MTDAPIIAEIRLLHLSGLSWQEACHHVMSAAGSPPALIEQTATWLAATYLDNCAAYRDSDGRPMPRWMFDPAADRRDALE
jgi:hypothetical protein